MYFGGGTIPAKARIPILLLTISNVVNTARLAKKYYTLSSEKLGDYAYTLAEPISRGTNIQSSPFIISETWHSMAIKMLEKMATPSDYQIRKVNE